MKPLQVSLLIEQTHPNGTTSQQRKPYTVKISYEAWIKATRANMLARNQRILEEVKNGVVHWRAADYLPLEPSKPKSNSLF